MVKDFIINLAELRNELITICPSKKEYNDWDLIVNEEKLKAYTENILNIKRMITILKLK